MIINHETEANKHETEAKQYTKQKLNFWFSVGLVFLFSVGLVQPVRAAEASLFLSPGSGQYQVGSTFQVKVKTDSKGTPINAAEAKVSFSQDMLEVRSISKEGSIFKLWPEEPVFSNSKGEVSFKGGVPGGFTGEGVIVSFSFKAKKIGEAKVLLSQAKVLAADGRGTDILSSIQGATFSITEVPPEVVPEVVKVPPAPKISSPTHPNEDFWYRNPNPEFQWEVSPDIIALSLQFNRQPSSIPASLAEKITNSMSFKDVEDGVWYFHLRVKNKFGWSGTSHFKVQIDTVPPNAFEIVIDNEGDSTNPRPLLYFEAKDDLSGISHYEVKIGEGEIISLTPAQISPFQLPLQPPGSYEILVKAFDKAGNSRESSTLLLIESIPSPEILIYPETYKPGEEIFYLEGTAPPEVTVIILFKKNGKLIRTWEIESDQDGNWSFSTDELFKSGNYLISAQSRDKRGAISYPSPEYQVKVILAGISIGPLIISYWTLLLVLIFLIVLIAGIGIILIFLRLRKLKKETKEAADSLKSTFDDLKKEIEKKIEYLDYKPGLNPKEEKLRNEFMDILEKSERMVAQEIQDIEKVLKKPFG